MQTKRKISIMVDEATYQAIENVCRENSISRSSLAQMAFDLWLGQQTAALMARGYKDMATGQDVCRFGFASPARGVVMKGDPRRNEVRKTTNPKSATCCQVCRATQTVVATILLTLSKKNKK